MGACGRVLAFLAACGFAQAAALVTFSLPDSVGNNHNSAGFDRFMDYGKTRFRPAHEDLRDALNQVLSGQPVQNPVTRELGCAIPGVN